MAALPEVVIEETAAAIVTTLARYKIGDNALAGDLVRAVVNIVEPATAAPTTDPLFEHLSKPAKQPR